MPIVLGVLGVGLLGWWAYSAWLAANPQPLSAAALAKPAPPPPGLQPLNPSQPYGAAQALMTKILAGGNLNGADAKNPYQKIVLSAHEAVQAAMQFGCSGQSSAAITAAQKALGLPPTGCWDVTTAACCNRLLGTPGTVPGAAPCACTGGNTGTATPGGVAAGKPGSPPAGGSNPAQAAANAVTSAATNYASGAASAASNYASNAASSAASDVEQAASGGGSDDGSSSDGS